ncbi:MAG: Uma2 family endonuclease, partial [Chloroflexota bacterium]
MSELNTIVVDRPSVPPAMKPHSTPKYRPAGIKPNKVTNFVSTNGDGKDKEHAPSTQVATRKATYYGSNGVYIERDKHGQEIHYVEDNGEPMSESSKQADGIMYVTGNTKTIIDDNPEAFVASDMLWYPVQGNNTECIAPDVMVVFGRPKGARGSYLQWKEENIPPQVAFEVWSPSNTQAHKDDKLAFYERHGAEEYYAYDPARGKLEGWIRQGQRLVKIENISTWQSPRLGIRFGLDGTELDLRYADGRPFLSYVELDKQRQTAEKRASQAEQRAEAESQRAEAESQRAEAESQRA